MSHSTLITVSLCLVVLTTVCNAYPSAGDFDERQERGDYGNNLEELRSLLDEQEPERRAAFECVEPFGACYGAPSCCDENVCFWETGFVPGKAGECVPCVDRTQTCQRDDQCCEPLVCQKNAANDVDGVCQVKLPNRATCYRDEQCQSGFCDIVWNGDDASAQSGTCSAQ